jgi:hypothetical protein
MDDSRTGPDPGDVFGGGKLASLLPPLCEEGESLVADISGIVGNVLADGTARRSAGSFPRPSTVTEG